MGRSSDPISSSSSGRRHGRARVHVVVSYRDDEVNDKHPRSSRHRRPAGRPRSAASGATD